MMTEEKDCSCDSCVECGCHENGVCNCDCHKQEED